VSTANCQEGSLLDSLGPKQRDANQCGPGDCTEKHADRMGALGRILQCQDWWARGRGLSPTAQGYLPTVRENLFIPLSKDTGAELERGAGCDLGDRSGEPAKMRALHSSAALVCNVFEYWRQNDSGVIGRVLGIPAPIEAMRFEQSLRTGLRGHAPTLDLLFLGKDGLAWGVESKFTEPYSGTVSMHRLTSPYFPSNRNLWADLGLPRCQHLAEQIRDGQVVFKRVDACQLLKHCLGLRRQYDRSHLLMLWYGLPSAEGDEIANEIATFAAAVDPSLRFRAIEYNCLFTDLTREPAAKPDYLAYLLSRYAYPPPAGSDSPPEPGIRRFAAWLLVQAPRRRRKTGRNATGCLLKGEIREAGIPDFLEGIAELAAREVLEKMRKENLAKK
jgi:hypothetical protein